MSPETERRLDELLADAPGDAARPPRTKLHYEIPGGSAASPPINVRVSDERFHLRDPRLQAAMSAAGEAAAAGVASAGDDDYCVDFSGSIATSTEELPGRNAAFNRQAKRNDLYSALRCIMDVLGEETSVQFAGDENLSASIVHSLAKAIVNIKDAASVLAVRQHRDERDAKMQARMEECHHARYADAGQPKTDRREPEAPRLPGELQPPGTAGQGPAAQPPQELREPWAGDWLK